MRKNILILLLCLISSAAFTQSWRTSNILFGDNDITEIQSTIDSEGSVFTLGHFIGSIESTNGLRLDSYGGRDYFVVKFTDQGEVEWLRQLGGTQNEFVVGGIGTSHAGDIFVTGSFQNFLRYSPVDSIQSAGAYDIFLAKYDTNGNIIFCKNNGSGAKAQRASTLEIDIDGDILIPGAFVDSLYVNESNILYSSNSTADLFYGKFEGTNGDPVWLRQGITYSGYASILSVASDDLNYYFAGVYTDSLAVEDDTLYSLKSTQDVFIIKTDPSGNKDWIREIKGDGYVYTYSITVDDDNNTFIGGYYNSDSLIFESGLADPLIISSNNGEYDLFIAKYSDNGVLDWARTLGSKATDKIFDIEFDNGELHTSGHFSDTLKWGGIELTSNGMLDQDMFVGSIDSDGNYRSANSYSGRNNSSEEARGIFLNGADLYTVIRSNSDLLILGDSIYTSTSGKYYIALGIIGCLPISIDNTITHDIQTCFGDSTGNIQILATGGFGAPWKYSIDNGLNYQDLAYFGDLPAGDYPIVVIDAENCAQPGPTETVSQPDLLSIDSVSDRLVDENIEIVVTAAGGSPPYTFTLQPDGIVQGFGTFIVPWNDTSSYYVEVNDLNGCGPVATDTLTTSSGIELTAPGVKLYPNPTSGVITLEMPFQGDETKLEVLNLTGQVMVSRQVYSSGGMINETFDISDLAKGMYMLRVDGQTLRSGVVVN